MKLSKKKWFIYYPCIITFMHSSFSPNYKCAISYNSIKNSKVYYEFRTSLLLIKG